MDFTALHLAAPALATDRLVITAAEERLDTVTALQVALALLPERVVPVPLDLPQLPTGLAVMTRRNTRGGRLFDDVPCLLASCVHDEDTLTEAVAALDAHGGPWCVIAQTDPRFRAGLAAALSLDVLTLALRRDGSGRFDLAVLASPVPGQVGQVIPLHTVVEPQR